MNEFLMVFRNAPGNTEAAPSPEQMQELMMQWQNWIGGIAAQNKLSNPGNRLHRDGRVVKPGNIVTNGPFAEIAESIGGYIIVKAASLEEATALSEGCPIFWVNGNVEIREIVPMNNVNSLLFKVSG